MLQLIHIELAKVNRGIVAHAAYVTCVLKACCKNFVQNISLVCGQCCNHFLILDVLYTSAHMLQ
jgi:hypothetical protein